METSTPQVWQKIERLVAEVSQLNLVCLCQTTVNPKLDRYSLRYSLLHYLTFLSVKLDLI
ncbi:hypothetical protein [Photobacterium angustum]|uniref:hypothetical protein n=1 Tax=Photobacterium angustum TaxID=661 RepID=UPI0012D3B098|nr:hypothetical protein [Photobacterium angustum]